MHSAAPQLVVGAIIVDDLEQPTKVFAARRTSPAALAGLWEFPGGKTEEGETPEAALVREIHEELGATVSIGPEVPHTSGAWPISEKYEMRLYFAAVADGELASGDSHDEVRWMAPGDLGSVDWLPSDAGAIETIQEHLSTWIA
ncbi:(deoxy)nucleoside triphosphate pyrophosphohydrolase [Tsukamurella ocularis]|uniref:(deoxy)nucleoside triphosphate pyrophosphohydrolase n=1 Tax=Tsukamurella ocularis TaxID=1970234 RepID=UPI0039EF2F66